MVVMAVPAASHKLAAIVTSSGDSKDPFSADEEPIMKSDSEI
jgi:hypothetical protein